jgi:hypothetical protein
MRTHFALRCAARSCSRAWTLKEGFLAFIKTYQNGLIIYVLGFFGNVVNGKCIIIKIENFLVVGGSSGLQKTE